MNVNIKLSLTDEERNVMFRRLTGKSGKGMVSRADVNNWVKEQLERFLTLGSPTTEKVKVEQTMDFTDIDINVAEVMKQNELLTTRVNRLQFLLDTNSRGT